MPTNIQGRVSGLVAVRWNDATILNVNLNWFPNDLKPSQEARRRFALDDAFTVVKHTLQLFVPTSSVVNVQLKLERQDGSGLTTKVFELNGGAALTANAPFQFDLILVAGSSYNIQHVTGDQNVAAFITESYNIDI